MPAVAAIYCDMDGVLADFFHGARRLTDRYADGTAPPVWRARSKSIEPALAALGEGFRLTHREQLDIPAVRQLVLSTISFGAGAFFADLRPLPGACERLWPALIATGCPVSLLSAPISNRRGVVGPSAEDGKRQWAARWLSPPPAAVLLCPSRHKQRHARPDALLIDDRADTIDRWRAAGGLGIHHDPDDLDRTLQALPAFFEG